MLSGMRLRHFVSEMVTVRIIGKTALVTLCPCVASIKRLSFYSNKYMVIFIGYCMCTFSLIDYHSFIDSLTSIKLSRGGRGRVTFARSVQWESVSVSISFSLSLSVSGFLLLFCKRHSLPVRAGNFITSIVSLFVSSSPSFFCFLPFAFLQPIWLPDCHAFHWFHRFSSTSSATADLQSLFRSFDKPPPFYNLFDRLLTMSKRGSTGSFPPKSPLFDVSEEFRSALTNWIDLDRINRGNVLKVLRVSWAWNCRELLVRRRRRKRKRKAEAITVNRIASVVDYGEIIEDNPLFCVYFSVRRITTLISFPDRCSFFSPFCSSNFTICLSSPPPPLAFFPISIRISVFILHSHNKGLNRHLPSAVLSTMLCSSLSSSPLLQLSVNLSISSVWRNAQFARVRTRKAERHRAAQQHRKEAALRIRVWPLFSILFHSLPLSMSWRHTVRPRFSSLALPLFPLFGWLFSFFPPAVGCVVRERGKREWGKGPQPGCRSAHTAVVLQQKHKHKPSRKSGFRSQLTSSLPSAHFPFPILSHKSILQIPSWIYYILAILLAHS